MADTDSPEKSPAEPDNTDNSPAEPDSANKTPAAENREETLALFTEAGFTEPQAQALVDVMEEARRQTVTQNDLQALELRIERRLQRQTSMLILLHLMLGGLVILVGVLVIAILALIV